MEWKVPYYAGTENGPILTNVCVCVWGGSSYWSWIPTASLPALALVSLEVKYAAGGPYSAAGAGVLGPGPQGEQLTLLLAGPSADAPARQEEERV